MDSCKIERLEGRVNGAFVSRPDANETGVVVLSGSSGRVDIDRARLFAGAGAKALALQWFGATGQSPGICEIPLETFCDATDYLISRGCRRIVFVGTSKGAEAALLVATLDPRVNSVIAISPSSVVWGNIGPGKDGREWPERSSWTWKGEPLEFVPADPAWERDYRDGLVSYRSFFESCLGTDEQTLAASAAFPSRKPPQISSSWLAETMHSGPQRGLRVSLPAGAKKAAGRCHWSLTLRRAIGCCFQARRRPAPAFTPMAATMRRMLGLA